jgi:outer membrane lipoprotein LolB
MRQWLLAVALLSLTACAPLLQTKQNLSKQQLWEQREQQLTALENWQFTGRTAITERRQGWNAGINWTEKPHQFVIRLYGPFAQGGVSLEGSASQVSLRQQDGSVMTAATAESLLQQALGVSLPVSALHDWVRGLPHAAMSVDSLQLDEQGRIESMTQAGWQINYLRYIPFETMSMPGKIFIKNGELSVRLLVADWDRPE